ncbi:aldose 1-epimerase family protein [Mycobacterium sp. NPDC048908]|uniref:aldose 1-epimerase family protein n=1 Tax=Mycobacterium sp. NPDC048908 TaxID=3364292 RepID=UPI003716B3B1
MSFQPWSALGEQYQLSLDAAGRSVRAVITEVAAAIRHLSIDGVQLTAGYDDDAPPPFGCGIVLVPWPNRVRDGRWTLHGRTLQLDITEPARGNALHGLLQNAPYQLVERSGCSITLRAQVFPQNGYPFRLDTCVRYALVTDGIQVTHTIRNVGLHCAPVAVGAHPFLTLGDVPTDALTLTVSADRHIDVDDRLNPVGVTSVEGTKWDLRGGRPVADLDLDDCWSGVTMTGGKSIHWLSAPDGRAVSLWADDQFGYLQVFITREFPHAGGSITAVAVEPMTAPADAFNSGEGLRWLLPGERWSMSWGIRYRDTVRVRSRP